MQWLGSSGQDGGVGEFWLRLLAQPKEGQQQFKNKKQPELTENRTAWKSDNQGDKEETFIQTSRRGGDQQPGGEDSRQHGGWRTHPVRWWIVERRGQAVRQLADPTRWWLADPVAPHSPIDKPGGTVGDQNRLHNPGLQLGKMKPQTSD